MAKGTNNLDVGKLVDELLCRGSHFNLVSDKSLQEGIEACTKIEGLSESDPLYRVPADRLYVLPQPAVVAGHETTLLSWSAGDVFLVFAGRLASEFASVLDLEQDTDREIPRPSGLAGMLDVYVENADGSTTQVDEDSIDDYLEDGRIFDDLHYRYEESAEKLITKYRILAAYESSRFPGFTLLGTQHGGHFNESAIEAVAIQRQETKNQEGPESDEVEAEIDALADPTMLAAARSVEPGFASRRRQIFLPEDYYGAMDKFLKKACIEWGDVVSANEDEDRVETAFREIPQLKYKLWQMRYTAGEPIAVLRDEFESVVAAIEEEARFKAKSMGETMMTPFWFPEIQEYGHALQLISICILLHREDLLKRMMALIDPAYEGEDAIIEDFAAFYYEGRYDVDEVFHARPYTVLLDVMYADDDNEAETQLQRYCKVWYPAFKNTTWHDSHVRINGADGNYYGYWAFEAAAAAFLCEVNDSGVDHMVYPRGLADFARNFKKQAEAK